jgi:hypothetical protein
MVEGSRAETWLDYVREGRGQYLQENWSIKRPGVGKIIYPCLNHNETGKSIGCFFGACWQE